MNTKVIGEKTEAIVIASLVQIYPSVSIPFGDNQRYDCIFEDFDGTLKKVQCKTGRYKDGCIKFSVASTTDWRTLSARGDKPMRQTYEGQVDFFGVYCPSFTETFLVPIEVVGSTQFSLRVDEPKKQFPDKIHWARDYLLHSPCEDRKEFT